MGYSGLFVPSPIENIRIQDFFNKAEPCISIFDHFQSTDILHKGKGTINVEKPIKECSFHQEKAQSPPN